MWTSTGLSACAGKMPRVGYRIHRVSVATPDFSACRIQLPNEVAPVWWTLDY